MSWKIINLYCGFISVLALNAPRHTGERRGGKILEIFDKREVGKKRKHKPNKSKIIYIYLGDQEMN